MRAIRHSFRAVVIPFVFTLFSASAFAADTQQQQTFWDNIWDLPIFHWFTLELLPAAPPAPEAPGAPEAPAIAEALVSACAVEPVAAIEDLEALSFENTTVRVNLDGLTPRAARALDRFQRTVDSLGGNITLTSAYRPPAYQLHLQQVWDKWMNELRDNTDPGCQDLKAQVAQEFIHHQLLESQRPVPFSDHTKGIGFDAAVYIPKSARLRRRPVKLDRLAAMFGLRRPDIWRDPVHFRFRG